MNKISEKLAPSATDMIRMDHTRVIALFHQYKGDADPKVKQANVNANCLAIEIHAQVEEEFFYPALREVVGAEPVLKKSVPEHDELRQLMTQLRSMEPTNAAYDRTYMELLRKVMHHVADEESVLLPEAERMLASRLHEIGGQMMKRRMQLMARHAGQAVTHKVRAQPVKSMLVLGGALLAGAYLARHSLGRAKSAVASMTPSSLAPPALTPSAMAAERASYKLGRLMGIGRGLLWRKQAGI